MCIHCHPKDANDPIHNCQLCNKSLIKLSSEGSFINYNYMVKSEFWHKYNKGLTIICLDCLEKSCGFIIRDKPSYFKKCILNYYMNPIISRLFHNFYTKGEIWNHILEKKNKIYENYPKYFDRLKKQRDNCYENYL